MMKNRRFHLSRPPPTFPLESKMKMKIGHVTQSTIGHVTLIRHGHSKAQASSKEERRTSSSLVDCSMTVRKTRIEIEKHKTNIYQHDTEKRSRSSV